MKILFLSFLLLMSNYILTARPEEKDRKFVSPCIDSFINDMKNNFSDVNLSITYESCFPNTLDTTVFFSEINNNLDTFIITGDIEAMWQRDSSFQTFPYLKFANKDPKIKKMFLGLINRQVSNLIIDSYANAFNNNSAKSPWLSDHTTKIVNGSRVNGMNEKLWERKYELDSSISVLFLSINFYKETNDTSFINDNFIKAIESVIKLVEEQSQGTDDEDLKKGPSYDFQRQAWEPYDSLHQARGYPGASCGLVKTAFRSSDDAVIYPYNIAENAFLVTTFQQLAEMLKDVFHKESIKRFSEKNLRPVKTKPNKYGALIETLLSISKSVKESIYKNGIMFDVFTREYYFAFEVDCFGNQIFMDDPGYPSLTSLPFFGFVEKDNSIYMNTRKRILSNRNPYYFKGTLGEGLGSPHTERHYIWPLYTIMRGLTSDSDIEIKYCIDQLLKSAEYTNFMHESFHVDDAKNFTRKWFAWSNSFFGYFINKVAIERPHLIFK